MKRNVLKLIFLFSSISLVIGLIFILISSPLSEYFCTTVEQQGGGFRVTSMDPDQAFHVMISFLAFGSVASFGGISGLLMGSYLTYTSMTDSTE